MTARYQSVQISPDGLDYITDHERPTVDDVWDAVNDQGSKWFFYPIVFVVTAGRTGIARKRIVSAPEPFQYLEGCTVRTAMLSIAHDPDYVEAILN